MLHLLGAPVNTTAKLPKLYYDAVLFWHVRDRPGTGANGQCSPGRGCSVCSSAARTFTFESIMRCAHMAAVACSGRLAFSGRVAFRGRRA